MRQFSSYLLFALLVLSGWSCQQTQTSPPPNQEKISGAYQALQFFANRTTYPGASIPNGAFSKAWDKHTSMSRSKSDDPLPWESMGPVNRGGRTLTLEFNPLNPKTLWIGTASGGLWRSYTEGMGAEAWQYVETGFPVLGVSSIAFPPADSMTIYIGTGEVYNYLAAGTGAAYRSTRGSYGMGILKSTDGGVTWAPSLDWSYDQNRGIWGIKINPQNPDIVYAATTHGVYKSIDAGENWELVFDITMVNDLVIHPENPNVLVVGVGNLGSPERGIYRSTDSGNNWTQITQNLPADFQGKIQLSYAPSDPDILYASIGNGFSFSNGASWLCRSPDFGASWTVVNQEDYSLWQGWFAHDVGVSSNNPNELVVVGITAWVGLNGGFTLIEETVGGLGQLNPPIADPNQYDEVHSDCHDVKFHPTNPDIVYVTSDGGVHRSRDGGRTYQFVNGGLQNCQFYNGVSIAVQDPNFFIGGLQDNGTISWNGDNTWSVISGGDGSWTAINPENPNISYTSSQGLNIVRFNEDGTFDNIEFPENSFPAFIAPYVICPSDGDILYAGTSHVLKSIDGGDTWELTNGGEELDNINPVLSMDVGPNPDVVYCATAPTDIFGGTRSNFFVTTDGGETWQNRTGILPDRYPMDIAIDPTNEATAYVTFSGFGTGHVYKTTNYGDSWVDISSDLPDIPTNAVIVDPMLPDHIYVGNDFGVYVSLDGGASWESYQQGLNSAVMVFDLKISLANRKLRAATHGNGAFQRDLVSDPVATNNPVAGLQTAQLFPNPAQDAIQLSIELERSLDIQLQLINTQGQLVADRLPVQYPAGRQQISWSCAGLPAGLYYLKIASKIGSHTIPLVVVN